MAPKQVFYDYEQDLVDMICDPIVRLNWYSIQVIYNAEIQTEWENKMWMVILFFRVFIKLIENNNYVFVKHKYHDDNEVHNVYL